METHSEMLFSALHTLGRDDVSAEMKRIDSLVLHSVSHRMCYKSIWKVAQKLQCKLCLERCTSAEKRFPLQTTGASPHCHPVNNWKKKWQMNAYSKEISHCSLLEESSFHQRLQAKFLFTSFIFHFTAFPTETVFSNLRDISSFSNPILITCELMWSLL